MPKRSDQSDSINPNIVTSSNDAAADLIRHKLSNIYQDEPDTLQEISEVKGQPAQSVHQKYMQELVASGKDLASIQTEWHEYYQKLSDKDKHQVWQEFYSSQSSFGNKPLAKIQAAPLTNKQDVKTNRRRKPMINSDLMKAEEIKAAIIDKVSAGGKLKVKHQLQSLGFGLGMGALVVFIYLFSFFNQIIIAPFIQPSRASADTPLIIGTNTIAPTATPEVIIPKINVQIPIDFSETSTNEAAIENDLENGVVHYPTTSLPGQDGNTAFFGHSSNNIFNKGKYKFAFVLLHELVKGDTFYLSYNSKVYVYKVISTQVVSPSDVGVLNPVPGQTATATLITCDPPGTSINRLVVVGEQISPDPSSDGAAAVATSTTSPAALPNDGESAWSKFTGSLYGKVIVGLSAVGIVGLVIWPTRRS